MERFLEDVKYDLLVPPLGFDFYSMTPRQARENFEWFLSKIPERIEYLTNRCAKDLNISVKEIKLSPYSLKTIWKWFLQTALVEETPAKEVAEMEKKFGHLGESFINREQFSVATRYIIRDIGMYLGEVFTTNHDGITWGYYSKPKSDMFVNQPQLMGFIDINYRPPFKPTFQPIHMAEVQATKLFGKTSRDTDLYDIFRQWVQFVPA